MICRFDIKLLIYAGLTEHVNRKTYVVIFGILNKETGLLVTVAYKRINSSALYFLDNFCPVLNKIILLVMQTFNNLFENLLVQIYLKSCLNNFDINSAVIR